MSNKITEEQYQKIVEIVKRYHDDKIKKTDVLSYMYDDFELKGDEDAQVFDKVLALANPLTREWAHDKFVDKEKKYYWKLNCLYLVKDNFDGSIIFDSYKTLFTESEIKAWGYNPEMFDKEE